MNRHKIALIKGDGIGPEIIDEAVKVLDAVSLTEKIEFSYTEYLMGGISIDIKGTPITDEAISGCLDSDAVLFGAIGGNKWDNLPRDKRPEAGLLKLRKSLGAFANFRPTIVFDELVNASTLKPEIIQGVDLLVIRELIGDIYFGEPRMNDGDKAFNTMVYTKGEIERIAHIAFQASQKRRMKVCSIDKSNVLEVSKLWRDVVSEVAKQYPDVTLSHMYVDNAAMQLVRNPKQFDVVLTGNLFGDILSDEASMISGSIGLLPSASIGGQVSIYEPIHGSAPDIAGQGIANPIATILSAAMMLRHSLNKESAAKKIEDAIRDVLKDGYRTNDLSSYDAKEVCSTSEIGSIIADRVSKM